jgi:Type I phosphodiesterase / nucleotide pyrophosphatase
MSWLARQTVDLWGTLTRAYYARKYRVLAKHLGRPPVPPVTPRRPGFIIIEIDGLSYDHLHLALDQGYMPHVREMLESSQAQVSRWRCGLPSTTPAVQAGLLYGDNSDIPGFRWYEKDHHTSVVVKRPDQVRALARRLSRAGYGLLHGGSSYTNMFDGDADLALFTVSTVGRFHFFDNVRGLGFFLLFLLSPVRVARMLGLSIREYGRDLVQRFLQLFRSAPVISTPLLSPLYRIVVDVVFGEIVVFGMMLDVYRGVSSLYATFYGYDEVAHLLGPDHPEALRALRRIDAQIHQVDRMRKLYHRREYDLYVTSDHGMSASESFQTRTGMTLGRFILDSIGEPLALDEQSGHEAHSSAQARFLLDELQAWTERYTPRGTRVMQRAHASLDRRIPPDLEQAALDAERRSDVVVRPSGGLAHVYFNLSLQRLNLSEIVWLYPNLVEHLLEHPAIGLIVGREGEQIIMMGKSGTRMLTQDADTLRGDDPLRGLDDPNAVKVEMAQVAAYPHSGDLILFGTWDGNGQVVTFEEQLGTHGGIGGPQEWPFILHPAWVPLDSRALSNPRELYVHFMAMYVTANFSAAGEPAKPVPLQQQPSPPPAPGTR